MRKFFEEKIKKPADELVRLAEINRELTLQEWKNQPQDMWEDDHDCGTPMGDGCEICAEHFEDKHKQIIQ